MVISVYLLVVISFSEDVCMNFEPFFPLLMRRKVHGGLMHENIKNTVGGQRIYLISKHLVRAFETI